MNEESIDLKVLTSILNDSSPFAVIVVKEVVNKEAVVSLALSSRSETPVTQDQFDDFTTVSGLKDNNSVDCIYREPDSVGKSNLRVAIEFRLNDLSIVKDCFTKYARSMAEIRKNAHIISHRRAKNSFFEKLPVELLIKIAGLTGTHEVYKEETSEKIANQILCPTPSNPIRQK